MSRTRAPRYAVTTFVAVFTLALGSLVLAAQSGSSDGQHNARSEEYDALNDEQQERFNTCFKQRTGFLDPEFSALEEPSDPTIWVGSYEAPTWGNAFKRATAPLRSLSSLSSLRTAYAFSAQELLTSGIDLQALQADVIAGSVGVTSYSDDDTYELLLPDAPASTTTTPNDQTIRPWGTMLQALPNNGCSDCHSGRRTSLDDLYFVAPRAVLQGVNSQRRLMAWDATEPVNLTAIWLAAFSGCLEESRSSDSSGTEH